MRAKQARDRFINAIAMTLTIILFVVLIAIAFIAKRGVEGYWSGSDELRSTVQAMQTQMAR